MRHLMSEDRHSGRTSGPWCVADQVFGAPLVHVAARCTMWSSMLRAAAGISGVTKALQRLTLMAAT